LPGLERHRSILLHPNVSSQGAQFGQVISAIAKIGPQFTKTNTVARFLIRVPQ
jgi:hypothetical protein